VIERSKTSGRVVVGAVTLERSITIGRIVVAANVVGERVSASGSVEKPAGVAKERKNASGGIEAAISIVTQGAETRSHILVAGSEVVKCLETSAGVPDSSGAAHEHPDTFAIVRAEYGAFRVGTHRLRDRCKPRAGEEERDEEETAYNRGRLDTR